MSPIERSPRARNSRRLALAPEPLEGRLALSGYATLVASFGGWHGRPSVGPTATVTVGTAPPPVFPQFPTPDVINNAFTVRPPKGTGR